MEKDKLTTTDKRGAHAGEASLTNNVKRGTITAMAKEKQLQVRVSEEMHARITKAATDRGISVTTLVMLALQQYAPEIRPQTLLQQLADTDKLNKLYKNNQERQDAFDEEAKK